MRLRLINPTKVAVFTITLLAASCSAQTPQVVTPTPTISAEVVTSSEIPDHPQEEAWQVPEHAIAIRRVEGNGEFYDLSTGERFVPRGVNYVFVPQSDGSATTLLLKVGVYDPELTREDFLNLASDGYNTTRVFLDHCGAGPGCIGDEDKEGLNPAYLDNIADMMQAAKEAGIYLLLTSNDLPDQGGYSEEANLLEGDAFAGYRNSYYLTPNAVTATRRYWRDLLTGLIERESAFDSVLGWQLLNEQWMFADQPPLSLNEGLVETTTGTYDMGDPEQKESMVSEGLIHYIAEMKEEILTHDPTALVTMGFFVPALVAPGWYVETASLLQSSDLDFFDFHSYAGSIDLRAHAEHFGMIDYDDKPIIMGEYGPFRNIFGDQVSAARSTTNWVGESCDYGFDGWIYWAFYPANANVDDRTWGFTDDDNYFQTLLAPVNQPDPCIPVDVSSGNIAYQKPTQASRSLPEEPADLAVDENASTQWGAGADAPQWIEIDLDGNYSIDEIRLLVAQYPAGDTIHQIQLRVSESTTYETTHEFRAFTEDDEWLVYAPDSGNENISAIRIRTLSSPSWVAWKEIQVFGAESAPR